MQLLTWVEIEQAESEGRLRSLEYDGFTVSASADKGRASFEMPTETKIGEALRAVATMVLVGL